MQVDACGALLKPRSFTCTMDIDQDNNNRSGDDLLDEFGTWADILDPTTASPLPIQIPDSTPLIGRAGDVAVFRNVHVVVGLQHFHMTSAMLGLQMPFRSMYQSSPITTVRVWAEGDGDPPRWIRRRVGRVYVSSLTPCALAADALRCYATLHWNDVLYSCRLNPHLHARSLDDIERSAIYGHQPLRYSEGWLLFSSPRNATARHVCLTTLKLGNGLPEHNHWTSISVSRRASNQVDRLATATWLRYTCCRGAVQLGRLNVDTTSTVSNFMRFLSCLYPLLFKGSRRRRDVLCECTSCQGRPPKVTQMERRRHLQRDELAERAQKARLQHRSDVQTVPLVLDEGASTAITAIPTTSTMPILSECFPITIDSDRVPSSPSIELNLEDLPAAAQSPSADEPWMRPSTPPPQVSIVTAAPPGTPLSAQRKAGLRQEEAEGIALAADAFLAPEDLEPIIEDDWEDSDNAEDDLEEGTPPYTPSSSPSLMSLDRELAKECHQSTVEYNVSSPPPPSPPRQSQSLDTTATSSTMLPTTFTALPPRAIGVPASVISENTPDPFFAEGSHIADRSARQWNDVHPEEGVYI
ncbi:hypothetical protein NM688_g8 [Phlebia brevispora]|uniref:Uncharacterized protein n=1 Tax=Phlebia brevispora TaxID=194682 RepID=A0ACC1TFI4_9APHY|nr:hypothetical protein NM688_g8 [Phlebia brevispora]